MIVSIRTLVRAVAVAMAAMPSLSFAVPVHAGEAKPIIWTPERAGNAYRMKMGIKLPFHWTTSFGIDVGFDGASRQTESITASNAPANMMWGSFAMPDTHQFLLWHKAALSLNVNPALGSGNLGIVTGRAWNFGDNLIASVDDHYGMSYNGVSQDPPQWRTTKSVRVEVVPTGTAFIAQTHSSLHDPEFHTSLRAEQRLTSSLSVNTSVDDVFSENPRQSIGARFFRRW